jgi:hypothetical protein
VKQDQATDVAEPLSGPDGAVGAIVMAPEGASGVRLLLPLQADKHNSRAVIRADNRVRIPPPIPVRWPRDGNDGARRSSNRRQ